MLRRSAVARKSNWKSTPAGSNRRGPPDELRPTIRPQYLEQFISLDAEWPRRRLKAWNAEEFLRHGRHTWPKQVGFYNAGDNFELTPEFRWRLFNQNKDVKWWTQTANEQTVIDMLPMVEKEPATWLPRIEAVLAAHVARFGADHVIYNAAMQAVAFARDVPRVLQLKAEMESLGLEPSAQTFVNCMLACFLGGRPKEEAFAHFKAGVQSGALSAVMRLDTEFDMWWDQFTRLGSFTGGKDNAQKGWLTNAAKEEGAKPMPRDMFAIWGWDRTERKYISKMAYRWEEVNRRGNQYHGSGFGAKYQSVVREPWFKYKGTFPWDFKGPQVPPRTRRAMQTFFQDAPRPAGPATAKQ